MSAPNKALERTVIRNVPAEHASRAASSPRTRHCSAAQRLRYEALFRLGNGDAISADQLPSPEAPNGRRRNSADWRCWKLRCVARTTTLTWARCTKSTLTRPPMTSATYQSTDYRRSGRTPQPFPITGCVSASTTFFHYFDPSQAISTPDGDLEAPRLGDMPERLSNVCVYEHLG